MRQSGFTLVEILTVAGVAALLAGVALPTYHAQIVKARRADGAEALQRLRLAQERHLASTGGYATTLSQLGGSARAVLSAQGLYTIELRPDGPDGFVAAAIGRGPQADDAQCGRLTLTVREGFETLGPSPRCWSR